MAVHSSHPASAPPSAPVREKTGHLLLRGWCVFVLFAAFVGVGWVNAFDLLGPGVGAVVAGLVVAASVAVSAAVFAVVRPPVIWRRLPWFVGAYVAWAGVATLWSASFEAAVLQWLLLIALALQGLFVGAALTWRDVVRATASALKWVLGLSLLLELAIWIFGTHHDGLFGNERIRGLWGDPDLLAAVSVTAIIVFAVRFASGAPRRWMLGAWMALAALFVVRAASVSAYLSAAAVVVVLTTVLLMRRAVRPRARTKYYVGYAVVGAGAALWLWFAREAIFDDVVSASGEATTVWMDVGMRLGVVGSVLLGLTYLAFVWRSWFFAVDRPRWDLRADRPYSPLTLVPTLVGAVLLVQAVTGGATLMVWGWMLLVLLAGKIKQSPLVGVGPAEQRIAIERGERVASS